MTLENAVREALLNPKYDYLTGRRQSLSQIIFDKILEIIGFFLERLQFDFTGDGINTKFLFYSFLIIFILMTIIIATLILSSRNKNRKRALDTEIFDQYRQNKLTLKELCNLYEKFEKDGDFNQAVRYQYLALIVIINDKNIVKIKDSTTGGQLIKEIGKAAPGLLSGVKATVNMFYMLRFGGKEITLEDFKSYKTQYISLLKEASCE